MPEDNPVAGHPYGGRNDPKGGEGLPGERPDPEDSTPPGHSDGEHETASRAPEDGPMSSGGVEAPRPTSGIPRRVEAPDPEDATDADPPGGSATNRQGRAPDQ